MKCIVDQSVLVSTLNEASRFVATKALNPSFGGIFLQTDETHLKVRATTGQSLYEAQLLAQVETAGQALVPSSLFLSAVKSLDTGEVTLEVKADSLVIQQKKVEFTVALMVVEDFPDFPDVSATKEFLLPTENFIETTEKVLVAASKDETKPVLTSVLLEMSQPNAVVTSDGFRLYRANVDLSLDIEENLLLPARMLKEVLQIVKKTGESTLKCYWDTQSGQVLFLLPEVKVQLSVVNGDFPPYRSIIPENSNFSFTVDRETFIQKLQQVMVLAKELSSIVVFEAQDGDIVLSSQSSARGKSESHCSPLSADGEIPRFACNGTYVLDFLSSVDVEAITVTGVDPLKPIIFGVPEDSSLLYLVMPFKLQE